MGFKAMVPEIMASDFDKTIDFYTSVLGFKVTNKAPPVGRPVWAELRCGDAVLMVLAREAMLSEYPSMKARKPGATALFVLQAERRFVEEFARKNSGNAAIVRPLQHTDYGSTEIAIADPDGYVVLLSGR